MGQTKINSIGIVILKFKTSEFSTTKKFILSSSSSKVHEWFQKSFSRSVRVDRLFKIEYKGFFKNFWNRTLYNPTLLSICIIFPRFYPKVWPFQNCESVLKLQKHYFIQLFSSFTQLSKLFYWELLLYLAKILYSSQL